ncbi:MAG: hypothetical protein GXN93_01745 [Candidatus Diapherotrites archaeon]|nr:hypothetical protein [Candidatus Diapherotrites archaeon]
MKRIIGALFAMVVLATSAFAAGMVAAAPAKAIPANVIKAELNTDVNTTSPAVARAMVATGEANAEGNAIRERNMVMAHEMNGEVNTVMKQARGVEGNAMRAASAAGRMGGNVEVNAAGTNGKGVVVTTMNMGAGKQLRVQIEENGAVIEANGIKVKANTRVRVDGNVVVSERSGKPIKVDPVQVVEQVKNQIRVQNVEDVELVDNGQGPVYVVKAKKEARLLGIIPVDLTVDAEINAENGAVVAVKQPWWAFLALG